jgi:hypothetical protein
MLVVEAAKQNMRDARLKVASERKLGAVWLVSKTDSNGVGMTSSITRGTVLAPCQYGLEPK